MKKFKKNLRLFVLAVLALLFALPVIMTFVKSLSYGESRFTLRQYWELYTTNFTYFHYFWNSVFYASLITAVSVVISLPLGFVFAKLKFKGRDALFFVYIVVMMLPFQATLLPNYIQLREFNMLNTPLALTVPMMFSPFAVFLYRQYMKNIPDELIDSTLLETSSVFGLFRYAVIPHVKPAIASLSVLIFCESWNMVEQALIFSMENDNIMPLSVILSELPEEVAYAGGVTYMFPIIVIFFIFRDTLEESMENYKF